MTIRIDPDGQVNVMVGGERPFVTIAPDRPVGSCAAGATASAIAAGSPAGSEPIAGAQALAAKSRKTIRAFSLQAWPNAASHQFRRLAGLDRWLGELGLDAGTGGFDGQALTEIGITNGSLTIDDRRDGQEWKLTQISLQPDPPKSAAA